jgi:hypothetical protein
VKVPIVFGLYFGTDLLMYNAVEPLLYGTSTGVSPLAILVAAVFWTWLWGPVGLLLATPLTVCVVVIGRHVPNLGFLRVMLSDEPMLSPATRLYQRLLALDLEEATGVAEEFLKGKSLEDVFDRVVIPALSCAEEDRHRGKLDERRQAFIFENTRILVDDLAERADELIAGNNTGKARTSARDNEGSKNSGVPSQVLCLPARDEADEIAAQMLARLLERRGVLAQHFSSGVLAGESLALVEQAQPRIACICAVPPFGYVHVRYLCRRLRGRFQRLKLVASMLTENDVNEIKQRRPPLVADEVASSLQQTVTQILALLPVESHARPEAASIPA